MKGCLLNAKNSYYYEIKCKIKYNNDRQLHYILTTLVDAGWKNSLNEYSGASLDSLKGFYTYSDRMGTFVTIHSNNSFGWTACGSAYHTITLD